MMLVPRKNLGMSGFDDFFSDPFFAHSRREEALMRTDIKEKDGNYMLTMDLPGYDKKDIKAELNDGYLTISATKNENVDEKDSEGNYIRQERFSGECSRSFYVGSSIKQEDIKASYNNGILNLTFPKEETKQIETKKYISIE